MLALLLLAPAAAGWSQPHADAARSGTVRVAGGALDVVGNWSLGDVRLPTSYDAKALSTPDGILVAASGADRCVFLRVTDAVGGARERLDEACEWERLQAHDAARGLVLTCGGGGTLVAPVVRARDAASLALRWSLSAADLGFDSPGDRSWFYCSGLALDDARGIAYVPASMIGDQLVGDAATDSWLAAVTLDDGAVAWTARIMPAGVGGAASPTSLVGIARDTLPGGINVHGATVTATGVVLTGRILCPACAPSNYDQSVVAWFDLDGIPRGYMEARTGDATDASGSPTSRRGAASGFAVARGGLAAIAMGDELAILNPETGAPIARTPLASVEPPAPWVSWPPMAWVGTHVMAGLPHSLTSYDANTLQREWSWSEGLDWFYRDRVVLPTGEVAALVGRFNPPDARLVRIHPEDGDVLGRVPLAIVPEATVDGTWYASLMEHDGVLLVIDNLGRANALGRADPALLPRATASDAYPPVGVDVALDVAPQEGVARYVVDWQDGATEEAAPGARVSHAYAAPGARDVAVIAVFADGRTATSLVRVDVGGAPPAELTALQRAFAPENQEMTFFALGVSVTMIGAALTIGRNRARLKRLEDKLAAVEEIRLFSTSEPRRALRALKEYRQQLPRELARGRIQESQYQVVDAHLASLLRALRVRLFAPFDERLTPRYHRLLDMAFADALLQPEEAGMLADALRDEPGLDDAARAELAGILRDFAAGVGERGGRVTR